MNRFLSKRSTKGVASLLLAISLFVIVLSLWAFQSNQNFFDVQGFDQLLYRDKKFVNDYLSEMTEENILSLDADTFAEKFPVGKKNLIVTIYGESGSFIFSNNPEMEPTIILAYWEPDPLSMESKYKHRVEFSLRRALLPGDEYYNVLEVYRTLQPHMDQLYILLLLSSVLSVILALYLCLYIGRDETGLLKPLSRLEEIPLELFLLLFFVMEGVLIFVTIDQSVSNISIGSTNFMKKLVEVSLPALLAVGVGIAGMLSLILRFRHGLFRHSYLRGILRIPLNFYRKIRESLEHVPILWVYLIALGIFFLVNFQLSRSIFQFGSVFAFLLGLIFNIAVALGIGYLLVQMKEIQKGAEQLAQGNLNHQIETDHMVVGLAYHGQQLNRISRGMAHALEERMKSERFKTELLTNVSHDLKTPLTSIINYVELLERQIDQPEKVKEYTEVLSRQSLRLKKLVENILEISKASTGNLETRLTRIDVQELMEQISGEYQGRFQEAHLNLVMESLSNPLYIEGDPGHIWRVFDNLLENVRNYGLEGTRVYVDACETEKEVEISIKNISRDALNVPADSLIERFVRGDRSRTSEGSGLGLAIAQSLMELQKGRLVLFIEGDLFKVSLYFVKESVQ